MFMRKPFTAEPIPDERVGVQVKLCNPLKTRAIPERFCGGDALRRGAISIVCTFTFIFTKFDAVTHVGRRLVSRGHPRSCPNGSGPQRSQFWGFPHIYAYTLCRRTTKFDLVTLMGRGLFRGQPRSCPEGADVPALPNLGVLLYL